MTRTRLIAPACLALCVVAAVVLLLPRQSDYRAHLRFPNAGLLVEGGQVRVAGRVVGSIDRIDLTPDGIADVAISLDADEVIPLRRDARATIRSLGAATITNRYIALSPGSSSSPALEDGGTLPEAQTGGIVDLDAFFDTFDARTRRNVQSLIADSAQLYAGSGAPSFNRVLRRAAPAAQAVAGVTRDLASDGARLAHLVSTADVAATTIARRRGALEDATEATAGWMTAVAKEREALAATLERAPGALRTGRTTLDQARTAITRLRPSLELVPAAARSLGGFIDQARPALRDGAPVATTLRGQLPDLRRTFTALRPLAAQAVPALAAAGTGMEGLQPIFRGLRIYAPDFVLGIVNGLAGVAVSNYDRYGHYARLEFIQNPQTTVGGAFAKLLTGGALIPGITDVRTGLDQRCPGAAAPPAPDGSSPIVVDDLCDPDDSVPLLVNEPPNSKKARR